MLFPFLRGLLDFRWAPVTWILLSLNFWMLLYTYPDSIRAQNRMISMTESNSYRKQNGRLFALFIRSHPELYSPLLKKMSEKALAGVKEQREFLASLAGRDYYFLHVAPYTNLSRDPVGESYWRRETASLREAESDHPSFQFGLSLEQSQISRWLTYQFVHSGFAHFIGNMIFLLIFGAILEMALGPVAFLVCYLGGGLVAAGVFLAMNDFSVTPMIGASGAVSALMALFCVLFWRAPIRFFFGVGPRWSHFGFIYLPAWCLIGVLLLPDLAGVASSTPEFGGIAYTAHLGGWLFGSTVGVALLLIGRVQQRPKFLDVCKSISGPNGSRVTFILEGRNLGGRYSL